MAIYPMTPIRMPEQPSFAEQMGQTYQLAGAIEQQRALQQQRQDSANLQQYLKEGGNLDTPEGIAKASEWAKDKLSPSGYQTIVTAGQEMQTNQQKRIEALAKTDSAQLDAMLKRIEIVGQSVSPLLAKYQARKGEVGDQQAAEQFKADLQPVLQNLVQQRIISPEQAKQYADATPAQAESVLQSTEFGRKQITEAARLKEIESSTAANIALEAKRKAETAQIGKARPAGTTAVINETEIPDESVESGIASLRAGLPRREIVVGYRGEAAQKWDKIRTGAIKQIMEENPSMTRGQAAKQLAMEQASYRGTSAAITALTKDLAAIAPYEKMLSTNANIAVDLSKKVYQTDSRLANKSLNWLKTNMGDNPNTAEFLAQAAIVSTEAARVLNNPRLVGQLTDTARKEMQEVIDGTMPVKSFERVVRRLQADGRNRVEAMKDNLIELKTRGEPEATTKPSKFPTPTQADLDYVKKNPKLLPQFRARFGKEP